MRRVRTQLLAALAALSIVGAPGSGAAAAINRGASLEAPAGSVSWLSAGDSYASGEGATGAAGVCQRSLVAWGPRAARILREQRAWEVEPEDFTACTGAKMADVPEVEHDRRFDVITLSIGGNDINFDATVMDCIGIPDHAVQWIDLVLNFDPRGRCQVTRSELMSRIDRLLADGSGLVPFVRKMAQEHLTPRGVLVLAGYPRLTTPAGEWGAWRGERCNTIHRDDAEMLGGVAEYFDRELRDRVDVLRKEGLRVSYASRLAVFDDGGDYHSLCARGVEWFNTVFLFLRTTGRREGGFHPNDLGHLATAEHAAALVEQMLGVEPRPVVVVTTPQPQVQVTAPPPTIDSGQSTFEVGERFQGTCTIAWPTAPYRGSGSIQMRMSCPGVPSQFLFVDVIYDDPDLPVTPSRSTVQISGRVSDIARSEMGFTVLVVEADNAKVL